MAEGDFQSIDKLRWMLEAPQESSLIDLTDAGEGTASALKRDPELIHKEFLEEVQDFFLDVEERAIDQGRARDKVDQLLTNFAPHDQAVRRQTGEGAEELISRWDAQAASITGAFEKALAFYDHGRDKVLDQAFNAISHTLDDRKRLYAELQTSEGQPAREELPSFLDGRDPLELHAEHLEYLEGLFEDVVCADMNHGDYLKSLHFLRRVYERDTVLVEAQIDLEPELAEPGDCWREQTERALRCLELASEYVQDEDDSRLELALIEIEALLVEREPLYAYFQQA